MPGGPSIWACNPTLGSGVEHRNGGTVLYGNASNTRVVSNTVSSVTLVAADHAGNLAIAPKDIASTFGASGWTPIISSGTYGLVNARDYIAYGIRKSGEQKICGLFTTLLQTSASEFARRSINRNEGRWTRKIVQAGWNYVTGKPLTTPTSQLDSFGNDNASRPTRAIPGDLIFIDAGKTIKTNHYVPKTT